MEALLEALGISKTYAYRDGVFQALDNVSLTVGSGEIVGLVGASGSGKSTIASIIAGLEIADKGSLRFKGAGCDASAKMRARSAKYQQASKHLQMVFQHPASSFSPRMRIGAGIEEGAAYLGMPAEERRRRMHQALDAVGLPQSYAQKHAWELSGGECQRAAIARSIIGEPDLLIADEPTSALDVTIQAQIVHLLYDLCHENGMACLFVSHDLALVQGLCSRAYVMDGGCIVEQGDPASIFDAPESDAARRLAEAIIEI